MYYVCNYPYYSCLALPSLLHCIIIQDHGSKVNNAHMMSFHHIHCELLDIFLSKTVSIPKPFPMARLKTSMCVSTYKYTNIRFRAVDMCVYLLADLTVQSVILKL